MDMLVSLVVPIVVSAAAVWVYSALAWMVMGHHAGDMEGAPDEDALMAAIRGLGIRPGVYGFPRPKSKADCKDPKFMEKWKTGPSGMLNVWGPMSMGRNMALSFVVYLLVSLLVGYIGAVAIGRGAAFSHVLRVLGTAGILGYVFGALPNAIWFQAKGRAVLTCAFDGVVQGLITGLVFAALWPTAA
ncbi:MAG: hypothetical protein IT436_10420 [Phycisphaerales bacterium]|nr:hypothetical protein [Phycisphaerales bacterium]